MQRRAPACGRAWNHSDTLSKRNGTAAVPTWLSFHSICSILRRKEHRAAASTSRSLRQGTVDRRRRGHMDRRPVCQSESGEYRSSAAVNGPTTQPDSPGRLLEILADKWDLVAQRPQLPGNSGSSGQRSCAGRRPSATRLSRGRVGPRLERLFLLQFHGLDRGQEHPRGRVGNVERFRGSLTAAAAARWLTSTRCLR
jgi:hypothetical protein